MKSIQNNTIHITDQNMPRVSVVIPTYNRAQLLQKALVSVCTQTCTSWEAIVINNYSKDNTVAVVEGFNDPRIRLVNFNNHGIIAASRNEGIRLSRGEFIAFLDSDDKWYPTKLARCLEAMTPETDLVAHGLTYIRNGRVWKKKLAGPKEHATYAKLLYVGNCLATSTVMVRKCSLEKVSGFTEDISHVGAEDYDLWVRLAKNGAHFAFVDEILGEYHDHSDNISKETLFCMTAQLAVINKHFTEITDTTPLEWFRRRRRKALVFYTAARGSHENNKRIEALRLYLRSMLTYPFIFKLYPAVILTIFGCSRI